MYIKRDFFFQAGVLFCCAIVLSTGCKKDNNRTINARVEERVHAVRVKKMEECRLELFAEANKLVDSLMLAEARAGLNDSLLNRRPGKPYKPAPIAPVDSSPVGPIFKPDGGR
jgi:hypothetical protein